MCSGRSDPWRTGPIRRSRAGAHDRLGVYICAYIKLMRESTFDLLSAVAAILWLCIIGLLHLIKPELDPRTRTISEYARGRRGWIMQIAFFCMAVSCLALAAATWKSQRIIGPTLLVLCGVGFAGAGLFTTDPVLPMERAQTSSGALHILFAFAVMLTFPVMATFVAASLAGTAGWVWLLALTALTWVGLLSFIFAMLRSVGRPETAIGYSERFLVLTFTLWLVAIALAMIG
jgi:hypothetical protein